MQMAGGDYSAVVDGDSSALWLATTSIQNLYVLDQSLAGGHIISEGLGQR
jgi:hypothetical protein